MNASADLETGLENVLFRISLIQTKPRVGVRSDMVRWLNKNGDYQLLKSDLFCESSSTTKTMVSHCY